MQLAARHLSRMRARRPVFIASKTAAATTKAPPLATNRIRRVLFRNRRM